MSTTATQPNFKAMAELRYQIRRFLRFSENAARQAGIEPQQHQLLLAVRGLPYVLKPTIGVLAERMQLQHHSTVELIDRLVERGFLFRLRSTDDKRQVLVKLTHNGEEFLKRLSLHHLQELQSAGATFVKVLQSLIEESSSADRNATDSDSLGSKVGKLRERISAMADQSESTQELLLDIRVAEASSYYKFYLNHEKKILGSASVIIFLVIWELVGNTVQLINPMFMSAFSLVWKAAVQLFSSGEIYNDLYVSGVELFWGYFLSAVVAIPFGISIGWYKKMSYIFDPFVNAMNATPRVALLPLVIIWLGIGILSKVGIIFLGAVFPILINTRDGVKTTPVNLLTAAKSFGASEWMIFKTVVLPSTIPFILTGLRLGSGGRS
jgi:NitT/TauT family transport system permease protein